MATNPATSATWVAATLMMGQATKTSSLEEPPPSIDGATGRKNENPLNLLPAKMPKTRSTRGVGERATDKGEIISKSVTNKKSSKKDPKKTISKQKKEKIQKIDVDGGGRNNTLRNPGNGKESQETEKRYWIESHGFETPHAPGKDKSIYFCVGGKPVPLVRHRTTSSGKFFRTYNPSAQKQEAFRNEVIGVLPGTFVPFRGDPARDDDGNTAEEGRLSSCLELRLIFRMRRPRSHFVNRRPGPGRLRPNVPPLLYDGATDIDNLAKFVMDAMNGVLYDDDKQIVTVSATKVYDNVGDCLGATELYLRPVDDFYIHSVLNNFHLNT